MPFMIQRSALFGFDYDAAIAKHIAALKAHQTTQNKPAPVVAMIVEDGIRRIVGENGKPDDFVPDYVIVDDTPKPTLEQRKSDLAAQVSRDEHARISAITPAGKRRYNAMLRQQYQAKGTEALTLDEARALAAFKLADSQIAAVQFHAAKLHAQIEDLPDLAACEAWEPEAFPA